LLNFWNNGDLFLRKKEKKFIKGRFLYLNLKQETYGFTYN